MAARGASYFALAFCHAWSIAAGSCAAVGVAGEIGVCECIRTGATARLVATRAPMASLRIDAYGRRGMRCFSLVIAGLVPVDLDSARSPSIEHSYDKVIGDYCKTQAKSSRDSVRDRDSAAAMAISTRATVGSPASFIERCWIDGCWPLYHKVFTAIVLTFGSGACVGRSI